MEVIEGGSGKTADNQVPDPDIEFEITVMVKKSTLEKAMEDAPVWQKLWGDQIPGECLHAALALKGFALNGFKPIMDKAEEKAAAMKAARLEAPLPKLTLAKTMPQNPPTKKGKRGRFN